MYESFFGLVRRPFAAAADADCYYPATAIETARQTLFRCIDRGEGAALLIGPAGAGKSLLLQVLAEQFGGRFGVALLGNGRFNTRRELLQAILYELALPYQDLEEGELRLALIDHLSRPDGNREGMLLLIDEAHTLPLKLLEEVRLITNLIRGGQPKVRLVLAGSPSLEERFTSPKLDAFNQRISARCYLQAFDRNETREYIKAQLEWAGGPSQALFTSEALDAVHQATQGVPRLINQVCDHALLLGCAVGATSLDKASVEEAWSDLQQLPTPWNREHGAARNDAAASGEVIEFGVLDDETQGTLAADSHDVEVEAHDGRGQAGSQEVGNEHVEIDLSEQETIDFTVEEEISNKGDLTYVEPLAVPFQQPATTTGDFARQDPLRRLAEVEQQIAAIDTEFQPDAGVAEFVPHVEFSFGTTQDPFNETFAEEELVIDPFAMTAADALANRPLVQCDEGRKLARLLKPLPDRASPKLSLATPLDREEPGEEETAAPAVICWPDEAASDRSSNSLERPEEAQPRESREPELIVLEDEPPGMHQVTVVRRGQYRQLFANLRRG